MARKLFFILIGVYITCLNISAAHKINIFAAPEGERIKGYVYFPGGGTAKNLEVQIKNSEGKVIGSVQTNAEGEFKYLPEEKKDYIFVIETADGHRAEFAIRADELSGNITNERTSMGNAEKDTEPKSAVESDEESIADNSGDLEAMISQTVNKQIAPLRRQIERYEAKIRLGDIIGGIGYIIGITGIIFYFLAKKRLKSEVKR